ncbi:hypothetical protein MJO52_19530 [Microbulbifer variabilis]|uniref:Uncharacterized protein n=1 Tax=Microbulbifer variabilis TaxID=266805 RepID=A0ABY4VFJ8_9GAMM|nr:hypothetical protein [Microbulbifer variabilis]USD21227.1 hypothetical protein MJO52_19530 [Microbulbifer variabilis]
MSEKLKRYFASLTRYHHKFKASAELICWGLFFLVAKQKGPLPLEKHPAKVKPASGQKNEEEPAAPGKMVANSLIVLGKMES